MVAENDDNSAGEAMGDQPRGEPRTTDDAEWVRAAVSAYEGRLIAYATHLVGSTERARDLVQETFVRLCAQQRSTIEPRVAEWLFTVCRNLSIDQRRRERRMTYLSDSFAGQQAAANSDPTRAIELNEDFANAAALLGGLSSNQQEVIRLKFQHDLSYKEIAAVTGLTVTNVGFLMHTGLKLVRQRMPTPGTIRDRSASTPKSGSNS